MKISKNIFLMLLFIFSIKCEGATQSESSQQKQQENRERVFSDIENYLLLCIYWDVQDEKVKKNVIYPTLNHIFKKTTENKDAFWLTNRIYKECNAKALQSELQGEDGLKLVKCFEDEITFYNNNPEELQRQIDEKREKFYAKHPKAHRP